jgi:hypothetical protein
MRKLYNLGQYRALAVILALGIVVAAIPAFGQSTDPSCGKVEGATIGVDGASVDAGGVMVTFSGWESKDEEPDEFIGFSYAATGGSLSVITVKAGKEHHAVGAFGSAGEWVHPGGKKGSVSNIVVCAVRRNGGGGIS